MPSPASINFNEVYSALQTKIVDGQENPLAIISTAKLYEVQKYCSLTNHMWDGFWFLANQRAWEALPDDVRGDRRQEHQYRRLERARGCRRAERDAAARPRRQGSRRSTSPTWRHSATSSAPRASIPNGRPNTATRPGAFWKSPPASSRDAMVEHAAVPCRGKRERRLAGLRRRDRGRARRARRDCWRRAWSPPRSRSCSAASCRATSSTGRWSGRTNWRRRCSCGWRWSGRLSPSAATSTCA